MSNGSQTLIPEGYKEVVVHGTKEVFWRYRTAVPVSWTDEQIKEDAEKHFLDLCGEEDIPEGGTRLDAKGDFKVDWLEVYD